jgi:hypothetical protein
VSPVPRHRRYYEGATTSRSRTPAPLWFRLQAPHAPPVFVFAEALPISAEDAHRAWDRGQPAIPVPACLARGRKRDLSGSLAIHPIPLPCPKTPAEPSEPRLGGPVGAVPGTATPETSTRAYLEAKSRASVSTVYASRATLPSPMQDSLPAGGLRLCREGVEPSGSLRKVSGSTFRSPFQVLP